MNKTEVIILLRQLEDLMNSHRVSFAVVIHQLITQLTEATDAELSDPLLRDVRSLFGGIGSLNDVCISKLNGHLVDNEREANRRLDELRDTLWNQIHKA